MREETIKGKFGTVSERDRENIITVNKALNKASEDGLQVNEVELLRLLTESERNPRKSKERRTLESLWESMDNKGRIHPKYDLFREGRTLIYSVKPNLNSSFPKTIFDELMVPQNLDKKNPLKTIASLAEAIREGLEVGPIIGDTLYLKVV